jgi:hypothetical protein
LGEYGVGEVPEFIVVADVAGKEDDAAGVDGVEEVAGLVTDFAAGDSDEEVLPDGWCWIRHLLWRMVAATR